MSERKRRQYVPATERATGRSQRHRPTKRRKSKRKNKLGRLIVLLVILAIIVGSVYWLVSTLFGSSKGGSKEATRTKGASEISIMHTGDVLMHTYLVEGGQDSSGNYDFSFIFNEIKDVIGKYDYAVANYEGTTISKPPYVGYPIFKTPSIIIKNLKDSGFDMLLTSNNHALDNSLEGLENTIKDIEEQKLDYVGTRKDKEKKNYLVKDIKGFKIGFLVYTFETEKSNGTRTINGIPITKDIEGKINSFNYNELDDFYSRVKDDMEAAKKDGAEINLVYMHWGEEYQLKENTYQKKMAQKLADLGADAIIGGHPHVVQPAEVLYQEKTKKPVFCLYSLGNAVSNQRIQFMGGVLGTKHTEDGMFLETTIARDNKGNAYVKSVDYIPTWVDMRTNGGSRKHVVVEAKSNSTGEPKASYDRTKALVDSGISAYNKEIKDYIKK